VILAYQTLLLHHVVQMDRLVLLFPKGLSALLVQEVQILQIVLQVQQVLLDL